MLRLVREAQQCGKLVGHIVGWGGRSTLKTGGSLLPNYIGGPDVSSLNTCWGRPHDHLQLLLSFSSNKISPHLLFTVLSANWPSPFLTKSYSLDPANIVGYTLNG